MISSIPHTMSCSEYTACQDDLNENEKDVQIAGVRGKIRQGRQSEDGSDAWRDFIEHDPDTGRGGWQDYKEVNKSNDDLLVI